MVFCAIIAGYCDWLHSFYHIMCFFGVLKCLLDRFQFNFLWRVKFACDALTFPLVCLWGLWLMSAWCLSYRYFDITIWHSKNLWLYVEISSRGSVWQWQGWWWLGCSICDVCLYNCILLVSLIWLSKCASRVFRPVIAMLMRRELLDAFQLLHRCTKFPCCNCSFREVFFLTWAFLTKFKLSLGWLSGCLIIFDLFVSDRLLTFFFRLKLVCNGLMVVYVSCLRRHQ